MLSAKCALKSKPDFAHARFVEGVARLTLGDFGAGWRAYEARWQVGWLASQRRDFAAPLWRGKEPLAGKTILLHAEQGLGDTIQFARYAPHARGAGRGGRPRGTVATRASPVGHAGVTVVARKSPLPRYDFHCPLLSLPLACETTLDTIPANVPYVTPADADIASGGAR